MLQHLECLFVQAIKQPDMLVEDMVLATQEEQVTKTPDRIAVVFEDVSLTYGELNRRSNVLAHKLRNIGLKPEEFVAILSQRSTEVVVGILGILKAGGAYLPIDDSYPDQRKLFVLEDCNVKAVLNYRAHIPVNVTVPVISLEAEDVFLGEEENPERVNKSEDLAYCIYTSGTTGKGKGVLIEHQNLIKLVINQDYVVFDEHTRLLQTAQLAFDTVSYLMFGGEKASEKQVDMILERGKVKDFINLYGPTEGTTLTTHYHIKKDYACVKLPIGKPISNTQVYVMNQDKLCGIGIPGELCIAGDGVARGYLNREEYTKEKFKDNPFGPGKLYYTGDLVRWMPDGNIEFTGRIDEQVKVRGFRIELGEIANAIGNIPYVKQVVVIVRKDSIGEEAICAYVEAEQEISVSSIKDDLRGYLPDYMIPSYIMQVESIPVTSNGKVNKRLLPEPDAVHGIRNIKEYEAAGNEYEEEVLKIWSSILRTSQIEKDKAVITTQLYNSQMDGNKVY